MTRLEVQRMRSNSDRPASRWQRKDTRSPLLAPPPPLPRRLPKEVAGTARKMRGTSGLLPTVHPEGRHLPVECPSQGLTQPSEPRIRLPSANPNQTRVRAFCNRSLRGEDSRAIRRSEVPSGDLEVDSTAQRRDLQIRLALQGEGREVRSLSAHPGEVLLSIPRHAQSVT